MYARSIVATLDFNANVDRATKTVDGKEVFRLKVSCQEQTKITRILMIGGTPLGASRITSVQH